MKKSQRLRIWLFSICMTILAIEALASDPVELKENRKNLLYVYGSYTLEYGYKFGLGFKLSKVVLDLDYPSYLSNTFDPPKIYSLSFSYLFGPAQNKVHFTTGIKYMHFVQVNGSNYSSRLTGYNGHQFLPFIGLYCPQLASSIFCTGLRIGVFSKVNYDNALNEYRRLYPFFHLQIGIRLYSR